MKALRPWPHSLSQGVPVTEQWAWRGGGRRGVLSSPPGAGRPQAAGCPAGLLPLLSLRSHRQEPSGSGDLQPVWLQSEAALALALPTSHSWAGLENGLRLLGSRMGPGGPPQGWRIESVVTSGTSRDGPGPGVRTGAGGPEPCPAGTGEAGARAPEAAGGAGPAVPEAMGAPGWGATAEVCRAGSGPVATVGAGRAVLGP